MTFSDLTRDSVLAAVREHEELGRQVFLRSYGFRLARDCFLLLNG
jgi:hypothetical protein